MYQTDHYRRKRLHAVKSNFIFFKKRSTKRIKKNRRPSSEAHTCHDFDILSHPEGKKGAGYWAPLLNSFNVRKQRRNRKWRANVLHECFPSVKEWWNCAATQTEGREGEVIRNSVILEDGKMEYCSDLFAKISTRLYEITTMQRKPPFCIENNRYKWLRCGYDLEKIATIISWKIGGMNVSWF